MFFSTREEELPKHFSKNSLRKRESKKNADEKKRGEEKRREEGMFVVFYRRLSLQPQKMLQSSLPENELH